MIDIFNEDCLEGMKRIPDGSIDMILTDPPYGITSCAWDTVIPFEPMWEQLNRVIKPNGAICLFGSEPFSSALRMSNIKNYKYDWVWNKKNGGNPFLTQVQPFKIHENIIIFNVTKDFYYPIKTDLHKERKEKNGKSKSDLFFVKCNEGKEYTFTGKFPKSIISFSNANRKGNFHPTQKPVELLEYLIKTYTQENETVLDFTFGSGSTAVACVSLNRNFIGFETEKKYFDIAKERIEKARGEF